jgi:chromosome segregation ATPase
MMQASPVTAALQGAVSKIAGTQGTAPLQSLPPKRPSGGDTQQQPLDDSGEGAVLHAAIQRLIGERDHHRSRAAAQDAEIMSLRSVNDELRTQNEAITLLRDHYLRLVTELLAQLKQIDAAITESVQKTLDAAGKLEDRDATLISLARRLSPTRDADTGSRS